MTEVLPLAGLRIAVTRPREQAAKLVQGIEALGGNCILFPLLEITPLTDKQALYAIASKLPEFQLAIFISPNAVRYGMEVLQDTGGLPATLQVASVGLGSAKALHEHGIQEVIAPQHRADSEALLTLPELQEVSGKHIVIFRGDSGRELLGDTLKSRGASVEYVSCYHRGKPQHDISQLLAAKLDALTLSSSEALNNLWEMLAPANTGQLSAIPLFVLHERIALAARKLGWQNVVTVAGGDEGLLSTLINWALQKRGTE